MDTRPVRAAIYARVSTLDQNPDLQIRELHDYAARRHWPVREFVDHGVSGSEIRRPQLAHLQEALLRHEFDLLLIWKLDRLFRSTQHLLEFSGRLKELRVDLVSVRDPMVDTSTPQGKFFFTITAAIAELERGLIRERVIAGIAAAKARGVSFGRPRKPLNELQILKDRKIGMTLSQIARRYGIAKSTASSICRGQR